MSLKERLAQAVSPKGTDGLFNRFGVIANPFPASSQTADNPHLRRAADDEIDEKILSFTRDNKSQVVVLEGTQGTGKTNVLNFYENELKDILPSISGYYVVRYLADPESSFDSVLRRLFQEMGVDHLKKLGAALVGREDVIDQARSHEFRIALRRLANADGDEDTVRLLSEWLVGLRILKSHKEALGINFRLDTVESKTAALRDLVHVSSEVNLLNGIFLLLDELEKQDGVLSATAVVRYLSSMRAIIDALPRHLFMMVAVTPDALRRYALALPAFRSRLENRVELLPLTSFDDAKQLANFYIQTAHEDAKKKYAPAVSKKFEPLVTDKQLRAIFESALERAQKRGDSGLRQREYLHALHQAAETVLQGA